MPSRIKKHLLWFFIFTFCISMTEVHFFEWAFLGWGENTEYDFWGRGDSPRKQCGQPHALLARIQKNIPLRTPITWTQPRTSWAKTTVTVIVSKHFLPRPYSRWKREEGTVSEISTIACWALLEWDMLRYFILKSWSLVLRMYHKLLDSLIGENPFVTAHNLNSTAKNK